MTMPYSASRALFEGNGAATQFPFSFRVWDESQLVVSLTSPQGKTSRATGWTAALTDTGGTLSYLHEGTPLPVGWKLAIVRNMPFSQDIDLVSGARFDPQVMEDGLDQAAAERQQLLEQLSRAVIMPPTGEQSPEEVVADIKAARDAAEASAGAAGDSAARAARSAANAADSADRSAAEAAEAEYWAGRAEDASNNGPATPGHIGGVKPRHGLSVTEDGSLDLNTGDGLEIDATENAPRVNASGIRHGILAVAHGGTGSGTARGALENLGLAAWQKGMESSNPQRLRNVILSGREKNGYPACLVGQEFIDMQHEDGVYISRRGTVSAGGEYSTSYRATKPLRNQLVYQSAGWLTPNTVTSGQWEYAFADRAHVLTGLYLQNFDNSPQYFPRK